VKKQFMRAVALLAVLLLLGGGLTVFAERPAGYDADGCMPLITEPGGSAAPLIFCRGDRDLTIDEVAWVDGGQGKAVRFNGVDEYFRIGYNSLQLAEFTLTMWVKWEGASEAEGGSALLNQRIFSARGTYRDRQYITLSPMETTAEGSDGLRLHMRYESSDWDLHRPQAGPLSQDVWHHLAVVADGQKLSLYLDGVLLDEQLIMMSLAGMRPQQLYLGKGPTYGGDGYFNGLMDNVYLYKTALDVDAIGGLIEEQWPAELTTTTTAPTTAVINTDETIPDIQQQTDYSLPPIPPIVWIVSGVVAALIAALIVTENIRYAKAKQATAPPDDQE
jgi:hypothetical protein